MNESVTQEPGERETRQTRGIELFRNGAFERISRDVYIVENPKSGARGAYTVNLERVTCSCSDFEHHRHIPAFCCKHLVATGLYAKWIRRSAKVIAPIFRHVEDVGVA